jgi:hypothetical protein
VRGEIGIFSKIKYFMKRYHFNLDNFERGRNKKIYITITDSSLKGAKKQIKKVFGEIIANYIHE